MFNGAAYTSPGYWLTNLKDTLSLLLALMFGTAGLPHILVRFYTAPDGKAARRTVIYVLFLIGMFLHPQPLRRPRGALRVPPGRGHGRVPAPDEMAGRQRQEPGPSRSPVPTSADSSCSASWWPGPSRPILSTVAGLIIACAGAIGHDLVVNVFNPDMPERSRVKVARIASILVGLLGIPLGFLGREHADRRPGRPWPSPSPPPPSSPCSSWECGGPR